jgi:hypothetical protein
MSTLGIAARQVRAALAAAPDAAVARVVAMLDGLADRGEADAVLESVRPRLRRLRPPRPLRLARLLVMPLEGALVPPGGWRGLPHEMPRSAIGPVVAAVETALRGLTEQIAAAALGRNTADAALIGELGARLWPAAGAVDLPVPPPRWVATGLPLGAAPPVLALCGALWRHGTALWAAREAAGEGPPEAALRAALAPLAAEGAAPLTAAMVMLLRHAAEPGRVAAMATALSPAMAGVAAREVEAMIARDAAAIASAADPFGAAEAAASLARRLADLDAALGRGMFPAQRASAAGARREGLAASQARFADALVTRLLVPAAEAAALPYADDATVAALEEAARDLHRLEAAGRRLGGEAAFDRALRDAVTRLRTLGAAPGGLGRVEVARLIEILAGPEAALPLLG